MRKLEAVEEEKTMLKREADSTTEMMMSRLEQAESNERRLRDDIRAIEMHSLKRQHAALKTS